MLVIYWSSVTPFITCNDVFYRADVSQLSRDFRRANETFQSLSGKLQQSIMAIRQIPGDNLLRRVPRLVRDVAQLSDKQVAVLCSGNDLNLDKSLVELLDAPLTHLVRNAIDHGIELPGERGEKDTMAQVRVQEEDQRILPKFPTMAVG